MSITQRIYANAFAFLDYANQGVNLHTGNQVTLKDVNDRILLKFADVPSSIQFKQISKIGLSMHCQSAVATAANGSGTVGFSGALADGTFDENAVTYNSWERNGNIGTLLTSSEYVSTLPTWIETYAMSGLTAKITYKDALVFCLQNCVEINGNFYKAQNAVFDVAGTNKPYIEITVDETKPVDTLSLKSMSPEAGSIDRLDDNIFTWGLVYDGACVPKLVQSSATFIWRAAGSSATHEVAVSGNVNSVTIPKNTFPSGGIQWRVEVTANSGKVTTSDWITLSTADATSTATAQSPKGEIVDASAPVVFKWSHVISTGTAQTKAELQISTDMQTWTALATVTGAATTYTAPANTLGSGTKYWRVRTYNTDDIAGTWSDAAEFICVGAPDTPPVSIQTQGPRPTIKWQSADQLAYQVEIAGVFASGTYYGTDKTWTAPMYLEDGEYTVRVRVQNEYALWSPWGAAALQVANTPTAEITLTAEGGAAAQLTWSATGNYAYDFYLVYRDGALIAKTTERVYTDLRSIGSVSYQVRGCLKANSNYRMSNTAAVTVSVPCVTLFDLDTGAGLPLPYSDSAHRTTGRSISRSVQTVQLAGRRYPIVERSTHYAETISVACVFREATDCAALEALVGRMIAVKTPEGKLVSGCLALLAATTDGGYYTKYQFDVEQTDTEEVMDIDA